MVLRIAPLLALAACATTTPTTGSGEALPKLKLALLIDDATINDEPLTVTMAEELRASGRATTIVPSDGLTVTRSTAERLKLLRRRAGGGWIALVEVSARPVGPSAGRFRWSVAARVSVSNPADRTSVRDIETQSLLLRANMDASDAIAAAMPELTDLLNDALKELGGLARAPARMLYLVMVDRFDDASPDAPDRVDRGDPQAWHGGDLAGLRRRLPQLRAMGVTDLWLTPIFASRQRKFEQWGAFHGYWTHDLMRVEPRFGGLRQAEGLRRDSRALGLRLHLDLVTNHVAWDAPLRSDQPGWFHPDTAITDPEDATQRERGWVHGLPDLAQENPAVRDYLIGAAKHWSDRLQPDGFRLDALTHVPTAFVRELRAALPEQQLLGEFYEGRALQLSQRMREAGISQAFDFPLHFAMTESLCGDKPLSELAAAMGLDRLYEKHQDLLTFLDNHDRPRIASRCGDPARLDLALNTLFALRGTPTITWGTESALEGNEEPHNRGDMRFDHRPLAPRIAQLAKRRGEQPLLVDGETTVLFADEDLLVALRHRGDEALAMVINRGADERNWSDQLPVFLRPAATKPVPGQNLSIVPLPSSAKFAPWLAAQRAPRELAFRSDAEGGGWVVVGNAPELGAWQPERAPKLINGEARVTLPGDGVVAVKLAQLHADGVRWSGAPNRYLRPANVDGPVELQP